MCCHPWPVRIYAQPQIDAPRDIAHLIREAARVHGIAPGTMLARIAEYAHRASCACSCRACKAGDHFNCDVGSCPATDGRTGPNRMQALRDATMAYRVRQERSARGDMCLCHTEGGAKQCPACGCPKETPDNAAEHDGNSLADMVAPDRGEP
jgi:hypothetical protein